MDVDRDTEVNSGILYPRRFVINNAVTVVHRRNLFRSLYDRPGDDVRKRCLSTAVRKVLIDDLAVFIEEFDRHRAHACRDRNGQALLHVFDDLFGGADERF